MDGHTLSAQETFLGTTIVSAQITQCFVCHDILLNFQTANNSSVR